MIAIGKDSAARAAALIIAACLVPLSFAHYDPLRDFCRRWGHQTAVVDNKLYIDGGWANWKPFNNESSDYPNNFFIYSDLDSQTERMPTLRSNLSKDASVPLVAGGVLWEDSINKRLFLFGGETFGTPIPFTLYSYDIITDKWGPIGEPQQSSNIVPTSYGAGLSISGRGEAYYFGGWISAASMSGWKGKKKQASERLVKYHMDTNRWTNLAGPDNIPRAEGSMVYIPAGDEGMLVYFGGVQDPDKNGTTSIPQPLDKIFLFDIGNSKWYEQRTTGPTPTNRRQFCAGAAWTEDRSSYNIYVYGGAGFDDGSAGLDDIYILSLPSCQWIRGPANVTGQSLPKSQMSCNVVKNGSQMLLIGGHHENDTTYACDAELAGGQQNIDLGRQMPDGGDMWGVQYKPSLTTYALPTEIFKAVGGERTGGARVMAPSAGFDSHELSVLMTRKAASSTRTATRDVNIATDATAAGQNNDKASPLSTGAIAGIVVGVVVVAVILCLTGCIIFIRRRRRHYQNQRMSASSAITPPPPWSPVSPMTPDMQQAGFSPDPNKSEHGFPSPTPGYTYTIPPAELHTMPAEMGAEQYRVEMESQYRAVELETSVSVTAPATRKGE
ncbi:kelch domain-protein 3 [Podospora aff. communis PSN243]|uniref:Kelch domain-protein 3 n=1 Tax=Podospora aff. communis PSN243 TaxID=3040156 RepID=A0AAV9GC92_9PEZI|nr:kelch domain-protein 3 [Podospora aff. communis PSN243]